MEDNIFPKGKFKKGQGNHYPKRYGGDPYWLKAHCQSLIARYKLVERWAKIAAGEKLFEMPMVVRDGEYSSRVELVEVSAPPHVQAICIEKLVERCYGKPLDFELQEANANSNIQLIFNFFKIIQGLSKDDELKSRLAEIIGSSKAIPDGELLQNQKQESTTSNVEIEQHPEEDI